MANYLKEKRTSGPYQLYAELWDLLYLPFLHLQLGLTKTGLFHPIHNW